MVDRAVKARIELYRGRTGFTSIYDLPRSLLMVHRTEARAMLERREDYAARRGDG